MKNKSWIIAMITFWVILIILLVIFLCYAIGDGNVISFGMYRSDNVSKIICDETYDLELINNIQIIANAGDLKIEESTDIQKVKVLICGDQNKDIEVNLNDGKLRIDNTKNKNKVSVFAFNNHMDEITVYVPKNYNKEINAKLEYGNIEIIDLENAIINIDESCGDINLGKVKDLKINCDYGDIEIGTVLNKLDIDTDCGSVKIKNIDLKENSKIKSDLGDVKIGSTNDIYIDANVDLGDFKINKNNRYAEVILKVEVDCGDIKVEN